jgi:hypothetical protein
MVFLAIAGFMFVVAAGFISGKQAQVAFRQAVNDLNQQIQGVVNSVANGEFPSTSDFTNGFSCSTNGPGAPVPAAGSTNQGANSGRIGAVVSGCTFMGKIISLPAADGSDYQVFTVAARQYKAGTAQAPGSFSDAQPTIADGGDWGTSLTSHSSIENGLVLKGAYYCNTDACSPAVSPLDSFGFFGSFNGGAAVGNGDSGAQTVITAYYGDARPTDDELKNTSPSQIIAGGNYILLCLSDGARRASITVGGQSGQQFTTEEHISVGVPAICTT